MHPYPVPVVLVGTDHPNATAYSNFILRRQDEMRMVAIVGQGERANTVAEAHSIPHRRRFPTWQTFLSCPPLADFALMCLPPEEQTQVALHTLRTGYHVLLNTPIATNPRDCIAFVDTAEKTRRMVLAGGGLRYSGYYRSLYDILRSGRLGQIISYHHERTIPFWHVAHAFLRGSSPDNIFDNPMLFQVGLAELDLMLWLLESNIETISSTGSVRHFDLQNAPTKEVLPTLCVENCPIEPECPFSAIGVYLERRFRGQPQRGWPYTDLADQEDREAIVRAIEDRPWGECVFQLERQVLDHQNILMTGMGGINLSLAISGHSLEDSRTVQINGTQGVLTATFSATETAVTFHDHATRKENTMNFHLASRGTDDSLLGNIAKIARGESQPLNLAAQTLGAHLLAFAAEDARLSARVINFREYRNP